MQVHKSLHNLPAFKNAVITVGTFDGVHYGHQKIINRIKQRAKDLNGESVLITFHPHPRIVVQTESDIQLLNTLAEKEKLVAKCGVDHLVIAPFNRDFSNQTPIAYIENFLVENFHPKLIVIGYNHQFGKNRAGNIELLNQVKNQFNFEIEQISKQEIEDIAISSSKIRLHLKDGNIALANELLGHNYSFSGTVIKGKQIGTEIGYPTANINIDDPIKLIPPAGIYAAVAKHKAQAFDGMLYIGNRPTIAGKDRSIEINLFDFNENLYGEWLTIELVKKIREDKKFDSLAEMQEAIANDELEVRAVLKSNNDQSID